MKKALVLMLAASAYYLSSGCAPSQGTGFDVSLGSSQVILLNTSTKSCQALYASNTTTTTDDISAVYFSIPKLTITWTGAQPLVVQYISIGLSSAQLGGSEFSCIVGGDTLLYTWYGSGVTTTTTSLTINSGAETNACPIKCGSVTVSDKKKDAYGSGTVFVYGLTKDGSGNDVPVSGESYIQFEYKGVK
ncbi:MAG: hypothetical protein BroJett040_18030 [Oligoflexia bacterium]|nr:MAG: hypothetical protein BroJett040_18030 [Oligoflexia bacterium]